MNPEKENIDKISCLILKHLDKLAKEYDLTNRHALTILFNTMGLLCLSVGVTPEIYRNMLQCAIEGYSAVYEVPEGDVNNGMD